MSTNLLILFIILIFGEINAGRDKVKENEVKIIKSEHPVSSNGMMGVASIAGITNRNGRVSSIGGIHFFPALNTQAINNQKFTNSDSTKSKDPLKGGVYKMFPDLTKFGQSGAAFVNIYPGAVSVSASTKSGSKQPSPWPNQISAVAVSSSKPQKPLWLNTLDPMIWPVHDFYSKNMFGNRNIEEWLHKDIYNNYMPQNMDYLRNSWFYPPFNPYFNMK